MQYLLSFGTLWQDLRFAARILRKNPAFTAIAVLTIALGIGANTAVFTFYHAFVLRPLPVSEPEQIVNLQWITPDRSISNVLAYSDYAYYRDHNSVFAGLVAWNLIAAALGDAPPGRAGQDYSTLPVGYRYAFGATVSGNYFQVLN